MWKVLRRTAMVGFVLVGLLQLVPYGWWHENPAETSVLRIRDQRGAELFETACADCHSNRTDWPVYSYVAPMSWLVRRDVEGGRRAFNLSEYATSEHDVDDAADEVEDGSMPPRQYELAHSDARLSAEERAILVAALEAMDERAERADDEDRSGSDSGRS